MDEKKNILVIDDEEAVRRSFELALEDTNYAVVTVDRGEKGIQEIQKKIYHLIFLDLKMPRCGVFENIVRICQFIL